MRVLILFVLALLSGVGVAAETVLTIDETRRLALEYNRDLQSARKELDRSRGEIISARSGALPYISLDGRYTRNVKKREMFLPAIFFDSTAGENDFVKIPAAQNNDFDLSLSLTQPLYVGGKVSAALSIAKIYEDYSAEKVKEVEAAVVFGAESAFYEALLAEANLEVLRSAYEQISYNLEVVEKSYDQGMVSEYELLRARVEKLNLEPQIVAVESEVSLSYKELKSFLGLPLDEEIELVSDLSDTALAELPELEVLIDYALEERPVIKQADLQTKGYDKAVQVARSDWIYPTLSFNSTYQISASAEDFSLGERNTAKSLTASLLLSIPLFDGGRTIGEVRKAKVDYYQALLAEEKTRDRVRLEVEGAYDALIRAKKSLELQKETINQAAEGLRIANLRYESGIGTQLEVLSAQTALTEAKSNLARAVYSFRLAKSALKKAVGRDLF